MSEKYSVSKVVKNKGDDGTYVVTGYDEPSPTLGKMVKLVAQGSSDGTEVTIPEEMLEIAEPVEFGFFNAEELGVYF